MPRTRSTGWTVEVEHPDTGRTLRPSVLDDDPEITPSLNGLAEIRIAVRKDPDWLTPDLAGDDANPGMRVWKDGERQPIEELARVEEETDRTILVGEGGVELKQLIEREYDSERRPVAFEEIITTETSYQADVDDPGIPENEVLTQNPDSTGELDALLSAAADPSVPLKAENGVVDTHPISWPTESSNLTRSNTSLQQLDDYSGGEAESIDDATGSLESPTITVEHTIPESEVLVIGRMTTASPGTTANGPGLVFSLNGDSWKPVSDAAGFQTLDWRDFAQQTYGGSETYAGGDLTPGDYIVRVDGDSAGDGQVFDVFGIADARYLDVDAIDNTVNEAGGYLDGPRIHPVVNAEFDDYESPFSIVGARINATLNDTSGSQRIQVSNDRGQNYYPQDGSEDNTSTVDVDFPAVGSTLRLRVRLDAYSPQGARDQTPRLNYASQAIDAYELYGDIEQELLLINERWRQPIRVILNNLAGDEEYDWSVNVDANGDFRVSWTKPGLRVSDRDPSIGDQRVTKDLTIYGAAEITGSPQPASGEPFTASSTFQDLVNDKLITGTEAVYDPNDPEARQFTLGTDYELDRSNGRIRAIDTGDLVDGNTYEIDYEHEIRGRYEVADSDSNLVWKKEISGVTSDRLAQQLAWVAATKLSKPRYAIDLQIPRPEVNFDVLEAFTLSNLDIPAEATPLEVREQPQLTPEGLAVRLGEIGELEGELRDIAEQVRRVSGRA